MTDFGCEYPFCNLSNAVYSGDNKLWLLCPRIVFLWILKCCSLQDRNSCGQRTKQLRGHREDILGQRTSQFILAKCYTIIKVAKRLFMQGSAQFVVTRGHIVLRAHRRDICGQMSSQFIVNRGYNIIEVVKGLFVTRGSHSLLLPKATSI